MRRDVGQRNMLFSILALGFLYGVATTFRYPLPWAEGDTAFFARTIAALLESGTLDAVENPHIYPQGFVYQAWAGSIVSLTGVPVNRFLAVLSPVLGTLLLAVAGFASFSRLLGSTVGGFLAAVMLFLVPEVMFSVVRGNHEKVTLAATLLAALAFASSLPDVPGRVRPHSWRIVFVLAVATTVSTNAYFGSLIVLALSVVLLVVWPLSTLVPSYRRPLQALARHLSAGVAVGWAVVALVIVVIYPSSGHLLRIIPNLVSGLQTLAETTAGGTFAPASNPYELVGNDWVSTGVYQLLSLVRWVLFVASFVIWLGLSRHLLARPDRTAHARTLGLGLYGAFGFILALSIPIDLIGLDVGSNLQVRIYVYFALFSAPMVALGLMSALDRFHTRPAWPLIASSIAFLFVVFMGVGFLKAVNDPLVSNVWRFYTPAEVAAIDFYLDRQPNRLRSLWIGPDTRLRDAFSVSYPLAAVELMRFEATGITNTSAINLVTGARVDAEFALDSQLIRQHATVLSLVRRPAATLGSRVYDNGGASIAFLDATAWSWP